MVADLQRVASVFLDEIAAELKLKKIEPTPKLPIIAPSPLAGEGRGEG